MANIFSARGRLLYYLGNCLIMLSLLGVILLFFPLLRVYFFPPAINQRLPAKGFFITIPKISAQAKVTQNVDPWNPSSYLPVLQHGVAQAKGTSLPGQPGTIFLFAHSSGPPWEQTWFDTIFVRLVELKKGDEIILQRNGKRYHYTVVGSRIVWPTQISYLLQTKRTQLILQTCWPIGTSFERLLVFAEPAN